MSEDTHSTQRTIITGIRATGKLHIGNLLGAILPCVKLQENPLNKGFFFVANLHTLTTRTDADELMRDMLEIIATFIAAGLDPAKSVIYTQSSVPETSELAILLSNITYIPELQGKSHFQEKSQSATASGKSVNAGLLFYPVLMAADILGVQADIVPVGQDQVAHVEFARDLAKRFNFTFGNYFTIPSLEERDMILVPGLGASGKMGKSESADNVINLSDTPKEIKRKLSRAVTDPQRVKRTDPGDPEKCNIFTLHNILGVTDQILWARQGCRTAGIGCAECKAAIAKDIVGLLEPIQAKRADIEQLGGSYIRDILNEGGQKARMRIRPVVEKAKEMMGVPVTI